MRVSFIANIILFVIPCLCYDETVLHCSAKPGCRIASCDRAPLGRIILGSDSDGNLQRNEFPITCVNKNPEMPPNSSQFPSLSLGIGADILNIELKLRNLEERVEKNEDNTKENRRTSNGFADLLEKHGAQFSEMEQLRKETQEQMENLRKENNEQLNQLIKKMTDLGAIVEEKSTQVHLLREEMSDLREMNEKQSLEIEELRNKTEEQTTEIEELKRENTEQTSQMNQQIETMERDQSVHLDQLRAEIGQKHWEMSNLRRMYEKQSLEIEELRNKTEEQTTEIELLKSENLEQSSQIDQQIKKMTEVGATAKEQSTLLREEIAQNDGEISELRDMNEKQSLEIEDLRNKTEEQATEIEEFKSENRQIRTMVKGQSSRLHQLRVEIGREGREMSNLCDMNEKQSLEIEELRNKTEEQTAEIAVLKKENFKQTSQINQQIKNISDEMAANMTRIESLVEKCNEDVKLLEEEMTNQSAVVSRHTTAISELRKTIALQDLEIKEINSKTADKLTELIELSKKNNEGTQEELEEVNSNLKDWYKATNGLYYKQFHDLVNYATAKANCKKLGARLASAGMRDDTVRKELRTLLQTGRDIWIGLNDIKQEYIFYWEDGVEMRDYYPWDADTPWHTGEPSNSHGVEDCVVVSTEWGWKFNDIGCSYLQKYLCEKES